MGYRKNGKERTIVKTVRIEIVCEKAQIVSIKLIV